MHRSVSKMTLLLYGCLAFISIAAGSGSLTSQDVERVTRSLKSFAAETRLLLDQLHQNRLTDVYAGVHLKKLQDELEDVRHELDAPAPPELQHSRDRVVGLAETFRASLSVLVPRLHDANAQQQVREEAERLSAELKE